MLAVSVSAASLFLAGGASASDRIADSSALRTYRVVGDAIPLALTDAPGDPVRGRAIVLDRQVGMCLLCHSGPFAEERSQGNLGPSLDRAGERWSTAQLRLRIVDSRRIVSDSLMPSYYRLDGLTRVAPAWAGRPVLNAGQIEDVVAFLATLRASDGSAAAGAARESR